MVWSPLPTHLCTPAERPDGVAGGIASTPVQPRRSAVKPVAVLAIGLGVLCCLAAVMVAWGLI